MFKSKRSLAQILLDKKTWIAHFAFVTLVSVVGLVFLGQQTYDGAPPVVNYVSDDNTNIITKESIKRGERVFHLRGLMAYGSFWGDGAERGPDFTADALHRTVTGMTDYYKGQIRGQRDITQDDLDAIAHKVKREIHLNTYDKDLKLIRMNDAQIYAYNELKIHVERIFVDPNYDEFFQSDYITNPKDMEDLASFFYWGAWAAGADRPGKNYSYTANWPHEPGAGNAPTPGTVMWSFISIFGLFLGIGLVLYVYGQMKTLQADPFQSGETGQSLTTTDLERNTVRPTQQATYKFFAFAMVIFGLQVLAGIIGATDFIRPMGLFLGDLIPFTVARSYHTILQIYWFFMCWVGYTIFFLPRCSKVPKGQLLLINTLFTLCVIVGVGVLVGIYLGQTGIITGNVAYWLGSQGWEFMELGRAFQLLLLVAFSLWILIIYRGVKPWISKKNLWSVPAWLLYGSGVMVLFLFFGLMVTPEANWAVADFWRWMVVHMWVEVTFEVFTTVIVAYMLVQMGLITRVMAERVVFLAVMLFLFTATLGVSHNFYWIAKPEAVIAIGSIFSTLQVLPLLLLTLDAWKMRQEGKNAYGYIDQGKQNHVMEGVWLFILGVNFWNVFGAGVFGSLINLPIVNYYEHATYLTGNHAHAAMFGVKGNIALGGMLFCLQHLFAKDAWNPKLIRTIFWSLNIGVAMMMFLDLFPVGLYQLYLTLEHGLWYARSQEIVRGAVFTHLTYFRSLGGAVFVLGGLLPLIWFVLSRVIKLQPEQDHEEGEWSVYEGEWGSQKNTKEAPASNFQAGLEQYLANKKK